MKFEETRYRWYILILAVLTFIANGAIRMCVPVLFKEISGALDLSLVDVGFIWGMDPLAGVFVGLPAGLLVDRFGIKRTLAAVCLLEGVFGALRGFSVDFITLTMSMFLFGVMTAMMPTVVPKTTAVWFSGRKMGLAQASLSIARAIGQVSGTMFAATVVSPLVGGWRNTLFLYSIPIFAMGIFWIFYGREPEVNLAAAPVRAPFAQALSQVIRLKQIWLIGFIQLLQAGVLSAAQGYLSMYFTRIGWESTAADGALTLLTGIGVLGAIPLVMLAYRIGSRKSMLIVSIIAVSVTMGLLPFVNGPAVWALLLINGFFQGGIMSLFSLMVLETPGVGGNNAGTALGLQSTFGMLGGFIAPPLGNSLAGITPGMPLVFWAVLSAAALPGFLLMTEKKGNPVVGQSKNEK